MDRRILRLIRLDCVGVSAGIGAGSVAPTRTCSSARAEGTGGAVSDGRAGAEEGRCPEVQGRLRRALWVTTNNGRTGAGSSVGVDSTGRIEHSIREMSWMADDKLVNGSGALSTGVEHLKD